MSQATRRDGAGATIGVAIVALGIGQIVGWGTTHYMPAVLTDPIATGLDTSPTVVLGAFSWGLLVGGASARASGRLMDRHGARRVMTAASMLAALGLFVLSFAGGWLLLFAGWTLIGLAMRSILYDGAFTALSLLAGERARRAISLLTLFGGFASTVFWPIGTWLEASFGWRTALQVYAVLNLIPCALLHAGFAGGRPADPRRGDQRRGDPRRGDSPQGAPASARATQPANPILDPALHQGRRALRLATLCFTLHAFVQSAMSAHLVMLLGGFGFEPAVVISAASLMGMAQVAARVLEMSLQGRFGAVAVAVPSVTFLPVAFAVVLLLPTVPWVAVVFVVLYGCGNGLLTIVRGALPLAVFGSQGYGELLGRIAGPGFVAAAAAPVLFSALVETAGTRAGPLLLGILSAAALASIAALVRLVRRSGGTT